MANSYEVLAQSLPSSQTLTNALTISAATQSSISSVVACNQSSRSSLIRLSVAVAGAADERKQYLIYDVELYPFETKTFTIGITLDETDVVRTYSDSGLVSFNVFGALITP